LGLVLFSLGYRYVYSPSAQLHNFSSRVFYQFLHVLFGVQKNQSLRELLLGNNNITDSSSTDLIEALGLHPRLQKVILLMF
jgi:hypothetical protein